MNPHSIGLRCQDVNSGLRLFDGSSSVLTPLKKTRLIGMAADLAALVRDTPLISNMAALETVAAAELDIPATSFDAVLAILESEALVELTRSDSGDVTGLTSEVPHYRNLYEILGRSWRARRPSQLEEEMVAVVNQLAAGPLPADMLVSKVGIERADAGRIMQLGTQAQLIKVVSGVDGNILYSPFTAFENPTLLNELAEKHGSDQLLAEFEQLRKRQGLPVTADKYPLLYDAVARGLLMAPSVEIPSGVSQPFATLPYTLDRTLLKEEKPVLDKALAILACIRCGQDFGGYSQLPSAVAAIDKLLRDGNLKPHSSSERQYRLMRNKGVILYGADTQPWGSWVTPTLIDTPDNRRALQIARDLLTLGEAMSGRDADGARDLLATDAQYLNPMKTIQNNRPRLTHKEGEYAKLIAAVMGYGAA